MIKNIQSLMDKSKNFAKEKDYLFKKYYKIICLKDF